MKSFVIRHLLIATTVAISQLPEMTSADSTADPEGCSNGYCSGVYLSDLDQGIIEASNVVCSPIPGVSLPVCLPGTYHTK